MWIVQSWVATPCRVNLQFFSASTSKYIGMYRIVLTLVNVSCPVPEDNVLLVLPLPGYGGFWVAPARITHC
jgi:hypothetical protein